MKKQGTLYQLMGFAVTSFLGTILHFLYDWSGNLSWIAPFSAVNESTWEHMKLIFWPMLLFAIFQSFFFKNNKCFWHIKLKGILLALILIPAIFYTVNGAFGKVPDWFNILSFFVSAFLAYYYELTELNRFKRCYISKLPIFMLIIIAVGFVAFTFNPPSLPLFIDPISRTYGI